MRRQIRSWGKRVLFMMLSVAMIMSGYAIPAKAAEIQTVPWLLSQGRPAYASTTNGGDKAIFATDGKMNTQWQAEPLLEGENKGAWIDVDLGAAADVSSIELNWLGDNEYAVGYTVLVSEDEENWVEVYKEENGTGGQAYEVYEVGEKKTAVEYAVRKEGNEWVAVDSEDQQTLNELKAAGQNRAYMIFRETVDAFDEAVTGRYIRVKMTMSASQAKDTNFHGYGVGLREIKIYGVGGVNSPTVNDLNIAPGHPTSASTEVEDWAVLRPASGAFDGDDATYWKSKEGNDEWVQVDLEKVYKIGRMTIEWVAEFGRIYDIQTSLDGENWTTIYRQLHGIGEKEEIHMYQDARYVRMQGYAMGRGSGYTVKELQIFEWKEGDSKRNPIVESLPEKQVVEVGEGSYVIDDLNLRQPRAPYYVTENVNTPITSNDWWSSILYQRLSDAIVSLPYALQYTDTGLGLYYANEQYITQSSNWGASGVIGSGCEQYDLTINTSAIKHTPSAKVDNYGDWSVDVVWSDDATPKQRTTIIKGSPFIYNTFTDPSEVEVSAYKFIRFFDDNGSSILENDGDSVITDHIGLVVGNLSKGAPDLNDRENKEQEHTLGLFMPEGSRITRIGSKLKIQLGSEQNYLTVGVLDDGSASESEKLQYMYQYAYTYVTDTIVSYDYDETSAMVTTNYTCVVEQKRTGNGIKNETLMCLFPHQWRNTESSVREDKTYSSARGTLKIHEGNSFDYNLRFTGIIPAFSQPGAETANYDEELMREYLSMFEESTVSNYWIADPYWQGKKTHPMAMGILIAEQLGEYETRDMLISNLKKVLTNWLSYDGEDDFPYYMFYSQSWGTLNGNGGDFGMAMNLTDHHFVWAYFIYPAAVLASYDPSFVEEYGDMLEMLIRDCMNPDKEDELFPFMRNFDPYEGHSWAGGYCDNPDGNNQESAGEATFAWAGLYLWGLVTGNDEYRDAGIWGWTCESNAIMEYWFDVHDDVWTEKYQEGCVGMVFGLTYNNGTYFGVNPSSIYGIHLLPVTPAQSYMGYNQEYASHIYEKYREAQNRYQAYWSAQGTPNYDPEGWYHIMLPFLSLTDADQAIEIWNEQWNQMDGEQHTSNLAKEKDELFSSYWYLQNMNARGQFTDEIWSSNYTSYQVFKKNNKYTATVWNPSNEPITVEFRNAQGITATVTVAANTLVDVDPTKDGTYGEEKPRVDLYEDTYGVPGFIEAADYSSNFTCSLVDDVEEGEVVGAIKDNSALTYNINVEEEGEYVIEYRMKSIRETTGGTILAKTDLSEDILSSVAFTNDEDWVTETWTTMKGTINLQEGEQELKVIFKDAGWEYDEIWMSWIRIYKAGTTPPVADDAGMSSDLTGLPKISLENATVTASSVLNDNDTAEKATDGNMSTRWQSKEEDPQMLTIELPEVTDIGGMKIVWEFAAAQEYKIEISEDGVNWVTAYSRTDGKAEEMVSVRFDTVYAAKYVRMVGTTRVTNYAYSIYEFELFGKGEDQRVLLDTPVLQAAKEGNSSVKLMWNAVDYAQEYIIYRALSVKAAKKKIAVTTDITYTDTNLTQGTYYYWVVASPGTSERYGDSKYSEDGSGFYISTPATALDVTTVTAAKKGSNEIQLNWTAVDKAESYEVYRTTGTSAKVRIAKVNETSYTDKDLKAGVYSYRVVAIPGDNSGYVNSDYSKVTEPIQIVERLKTPVLKIEKGTDNTVKLSWDKIENATEYRVYRASSATGAKTLVTSVNNNAYVDSGMEDGTYYYWVIAVSGSKNYQNSDYSVDTEGIDITGTGIVSVEVSEIILSEQTIEMKAGDTLQIVADISPSNATNQAIAWMSSDDSVVSVDGGVLRAVSVGNATVYAETSNGKKAECQVTVVPNAYTVTFDSDGGSIVEGQKVTVGEIATVPIAPTKEGYTFIGWYLNNKAYEFDAAVTSDITLIAVWEKDVPIEITVSNIVLSETSKTLKVGETVTLTATVYPEEASGKDIIWSSDNTTVATVVDGVVTGKAVGTARIKAVVGDKSVECIIVVTASGTSGDAGNTSGGSNNIANGGNTPSDGTTQPDVEKVKVTGVKLSVANRPYNAKTLYVKKNGIVTISAEVLGTGTYNSAVTWSTSDKKIATVNRKGKVKVVAKKGTAKITATSVENPKKKAVITVKAVSKTTSNKVLKLKKTKIVLNKKDAKAQIQIKKYTKNTTDKITYIVKSGKKYVKVNKFGVVTCKVQPSSTAKTSKIEVKCGKKKTCITVKVKK